MKQHSFSKAPSVSVPRSKFNRSSGNKVTMDADVLVPIFLDEVIPGDTHNVNANMFGRLATPINPILDNLYLDTFFFFVPMRLVWSNYYKFFGGQTDPGDSTDYLIPSMAASAGNLSTGTIPDYMGVPIGKALTINVLPFRAYWLIFDEWFRDQNLQDSASIIKDDTNGRISNNTDYTWNVPVARGKRHDYFTSCLPFAQKGDPVLVPLGLNAPIYTDADPGDSLGIQDAAGGTGIERYMTTSGSVLTLGTNALISNQMYADLSNATSASINEWRQAFQIQKFLERDARGGTRYTEKIHAHFGVTSPDARLQRPEYLGGGSQPINIHPVAQTSSTDATTPQANLSAFGTVSAKSGFTKSFTEHGYIIGLANVRADLTYQQGLDKLWTRSTQYDFYFPTFANLGEQAVLNQEIFAQGTSADTETFGFQERYAEYRYKKSQVCGLFRSDASGTLDAWHLSQDFSSLPTLGTTFIKSNTPLDRAIAVPSEPHLILDMYFNQTSVRPMPVFAPPGFIDHF